MRTRGGAWLGGLAVLLCGCSHDVEEATCRGGCGLPHAVAACVRGDCHVMACDPCFADCDGDEGDGCETDVSDDPRNCGGCGVACADGDTCAGGACVAPPGDCASTADGGAPVDAAAPPDLGPPADPPAPADLATADVPCICNDPPPTRCVGDDLIRYVYACEPNGTCIYTPDIVYCPGGCVDAVCDPIPR